VGFRVLSLILLFLAGASGFAGNDEYEIAVAPYVEGGRWVDGHAVGGKKVAFGIVYPKNHPAAASFREGSWFWRVGPNSSGQRTFLGGSVMAQNLLKVFDRIYRKELESDPSTKTMASEFLEKDPTQDGVTPYAFVADWNDLSKVYEFIGVADPDAQGRLQMDYWHSEFHRPQRSAENAIRDHVGLWTTYLPKELPSISTRDNSTLFDIVHLYDVRVGGSKEIKRLCKNSDLMSGKDSYFKQLARILEATGATWKGALVPPETAQGNRFEWHPEGDWKLHLHPAPTEVQLDHLVPEEYALVALSLGRARLFQKTYGFSFDGPGVPDPKLGRPPGVGVTIDPSNGEKVSPEGKAYRMKISRTLWQQLAELRSQRTADLFLPAGEDVSNLCVSWALHFSLLGR
jgi:hypothetical protein